MGIMYTSMHVIVNSGRQSVGFLTEARVSLISSETTCDVQTVPRQVKARCRPIYEILVFTCVAACDYVGLSVDSYDLKMSVNGWGRPHTPRLCLFIYFCATSYH